LLCVQYSLLPTFKDVVEKWQAIAGVYNSRRRIETTDVVVENRIVGQPFPVAIQTAWQAERLPYNSRCCARLEIQSAIRVMKIAKSRVRWVVKLQFLLA